MELTIRCPKCDNSRTDVVCRECYEKLEEDYIQIKSEVNTYTNRYYRDAEVIRNLKAKVEKLKDMIYQIINMSAIEFELKKDKFKEELKSE